MEDKKTITNFTLTTPMAIVVAGAIIGIAIYASNTSTRTNTGPISPIAGDTTTVTPAVQPTPQPQEVSIDDDPVLGNPDAPVTFIEFSDYECPFCKRHFQQSFPQLKTDFIDTGKVKLVFRDLPLSFHDPLATTQAMAANCAREQGGDEAYYKMHDEIFNLTSSNGNGMTTDQLFGLADKIGVNQNQLTQCVENETYKSEIQNDIADAAKAGASATPTFFVGVSQPSGTITGTPIIGAQDYQTIIKPAIEAALAEAGA